MSFGYDPEVPAGFQEADYEQRAFEEESARLAALRAQGICPHGWIQGGDPADPKFIARVREQGIGPGEIKCLDCGELFESEDAWLAARP